jgi:hypothetical protein
VFDKLRKYLGHRRCPSDDTVKAGVQKWLREQDVCCYRQGLENLIVRYGKCLNRFGSYVEEQRTGVQRYS